MFKLAVISPPQKGAQDGLEAHERSSYSPAIPRKLYQQWDLFSPSNFRSDPQSIPSNEVSSWRGEAGPPKFLLYQQAYGILGSADLFHSNKKLSRLNPAPDEY